MRTAAELIIDHIRSKAKTFREAEYNALRERRDVDAELDRRVAKALEACAAECVDMVMEQA